MNNIVVHYNKRKKQYKFELNTAPFHTNLTKSQIGSALLHYRELYNSNAFFDLTSAQKESVLCLLKKWGALSLYAHRTG
jgi:hypothetical protein